MSITPRDFWEVDYVREYHPQDSYKEAKEMIEQNREGDTYTDCMIALAWEKHLMGLEWRRG
jgi:hypothetical protein